MLWQVDRTQTYLLASVHILDGRPLVLSPRMEAAYAQARRIAVEADFTAPIDVAPWLLSARDRLSGHIAPNLFAATTAKWREAGLDVTALERFPPWLAAITIMLRLAALRGITDRNGIDLYFLNRGRYDRKEVIALEQVTAGLGAFASAPISEQAGFLSRVVVETEATQAEIDSMAAAWRSRQLSFFDQLLEQRRRLAPRMFDAFIDQRTHAWLPKLLKIADDPVPAVVVVGIMHFGGSNGIPALLAAAGRPVSAIDG